MQNQLTGLWTLLQFTSFKIQMFIHAQCSKRNLTASGHQKASQCIKRSYFSFIYQFGQFGLPHFERFVYNLLTALKALLLLTECLLLKSGRWSVLVYATATLKYVLYNKLSIYQVGKKRSKDQLKPLGLNKHEHEIIGLEFDVSEKQTIFRTNYYYCF